MNFFFKNKINYYFYEVIFITLMFVALLFSYVVTIPEEKKTDCEVVAGFCKQVATDIKVKVISPQR